jgi:replication factor A1
LLIRELREGIRNVSLRGTVTGKSEMVPRYSRDTGHVTRGCVAIVTDPTGSVRVPLWDNQVKAVSIGDEIEVKNAAVATFRGLLHIIPTNEASELVIERLQRTARTEQVTEPATKRSRQPILLHSQKRVRKET